MKQLEQLEKKADRHANLMLLTGLTGAVVQLVGFGALIFIYFDWNAIEPVTYLVCKFLNLSINPSYYSILLRCDRYCLLFMVQIRLGIHKCLRHVQD
jgi:hypothetical protein